MNVAPPLGALLDGLVDYAGLFPPAALSMPEAVGAYARHSRGPHSRMLGRFVLPVARLGEFAHAAGDAGEEWRLAVLAGPDDAGEIARFNGAHVGRYQADTIEARASDHETIWRLSSAYDESYVVYVEIPSAEDPEPLVTELAARGMRAKIRTGGVTADAFPEARDIVRFLAACARHGVPFKATAGLHHPLRGEYPLTYAPESPRGMMYGFLNVFLAATLLYDGADESDVAPLLEEWDAGSLAIGDDAISWRGHSVTAGEIARAREAFAASFGSCSFEEPVQDLATLQLLSPT